ncbi:hypothetical protein, partial [Pseudomonas viridiflava]|uniref:hypothetical protein n=1 Tax=Pseudomonas viridiflava TaxID=33069 RepID=UPI0019D2A2D5
RAQDVEGFILGSASRRASLCRTSGQFAEMFGEVSRLQKLSFFSIGHSLAALAFVVSGSGKWLLEICTRSSAMDAGSLGLSVCTA